ncbi:MAG: hypothetical protein HY077_06575 [Elusimicrobia bacterium]|nr:hypothetical protein [Elusimicrobiota bacterium]
MSRDTRRWAALTALGFVLLCASYFLMYLVCRYRSGLPFSPGIDVLVQSLPLRDWTALLSQGYVLFLSGFYLYWIKRDWRRLAYILTATAVMMLVRDVFLLLTPVGPLPGLIPLYTSRLVPGVRDHLAFDGELFFSGHTGAPFLYFLLSRNHRALSLVCLAVSLANGLGVLLTRNHYAIDVLGAFVIVPTVCAMSRRLFGWMDPEPAAA